MAQPTHSNQIQHDLRCSLEDWLAEQQDHLPRASLTARVEPLAGPLAAEDPVPAVFEPFQVRLRAPDESREVVPDAAATLKRLAEQDPSLSGRVQSAEIAATTAAPVEVDDLDLGGRAWELLVKVDVRAKTSS